MMKPTRKTTRTVAGYACLPRFLKQSVANKAPSLVCKSIPEVQSVRHNADPLLSVFEPARSGSLTSVTTDSSVLIKSIPHLYKLAKYPVVIHVSVQSDYGDITSIRNTGFALLQSNSLQEAQDLALTAHALAIGSGRGVIHFFNPAHSKNTEPIATENHELVENVLNLDLARRHQTTNSKERNLYVSEGVVSARPESVDSTVQNSSHFAPGPTQDLPDTTREPSTASSSSSNRKGSSSGVSEAESATTVSSDSGPVASKDVETVCSTIWSQIYAATGRLYTAFRYVGSRDADAAIFVFGSNPRLFSEAIDAAGPTDVYRRVGLLTPTLYRPWVPERVLEALPRSVTRVAVLESIKRKTTKWGPLLIDLLTSIKSNPEASNSPLIVGYQLLQIDFATVTQAVNGIVHNLLANNPVQNLEIGARHVSNRLDEAAPAEYDLKQPALENAYMKILDQLFGDRLYIANSLKASNAGISNTIKASPEYGFGSLLARKEHRKRFVATVQAAARSNAFVTESPKSWLSDWALVADKPERANKIAPDVISRLSADGSPLATNLLKSRGLFFEESQWLIGSDAWAYDLGSSGVHHVIASERNVNMLIIDSTPYSERAAQDAARRKKDIGLYAMNYGNVYVASVAVYSSYTQVLQAMMEAEAYDGPSVVLAYLPYNQEGDSPLKVLQETKKAVDLGYWPLYRWDPKAEAKGEECFKLDSERIKQELQEFLKRDNQMSQLMKRHPNFHPNLSESYGSEVRKVQKRKAKDAYEALLEGLQGAPMTILFASDNGNAENLAKRLASRGKARGLKTMVMAMDDYPLEDLGNEENLVCFTSTAGQGEFPQNGLNFLGCCEETPPILTLRTCKFSSLRPWATAHYWPRKEDKHYYNKPGKDLFSTR